MTENQMPKNTFPIVFNDEPEQDAPAKPDPAEKILYKATELEIELGMSHGSISYWIDKTKTEKVYKPNTGSHGSALYITEKGKLAIIKAWESKYEGNAKIPNKSIVGSEPDRNRDLGYYHRITPVWMICAHQRRR